MGNPGTGWDDRKTEIFIGRLLRYGVLAAAAVVLAGGVFYLLKSWGARPDYAVFRSESAPLRSLPGTLGEAFSFRRHAVIQLGLMILVAIPLFRVAFSLLAFLLMRDFTYMVVTLIVLSILVFSIFGGSI
jgi:uncharacterized membrane protein